MQKVPFSNKGTFDTGFFKDISKMIPHCFNIIGQKAWDTHFLKFNGGDV